MNDPVADKLFKRYTEQTKDEKIKTGNKKSNESGEGPSTSYDYDDSASYKLTPGLPGVLPMPSNEFKNDFFNLSSSFNPAPPVYQSKPTKPSSSNKPSTSKN